jgi:multidrug efflux pump subunit AcrA (membrane-fusion protein)
LDFGSPGVVTEISVVEGQLVTKGDLLAKLDDLTIKGLERDVAKLTLDLQIAEDLLEDGLKGTSDLNSAQLQEILARAAIEVREAEEGLEEANDPHSVESIRSKEQSIIEARITLRDKVQALEKRHEDHALVYTRLVKDKDAAEVTLEEAIDVLGQLDIDHAELLAETTRSRNNLEIAVETATKELESYKEGKPIWSDWIKEKDTALKELRNAQEKLDHIVSVIDEMPGLEHKITHWKFVIQSRHFIYHTDNMVQFLLSIP